LIDYLRTVALRASIGKCFLGVRAISTVITAVNAVNIMNLYRIRAKFHRRIREPEHACAAPKFGQRSAASQHTDDYHCRILGHSTERSTYIYTKIDIAALRTAALNRRNSTKRRCPMHDRIFVMSEFTSAIGSIFEDYVKERIACGYHYAVGCDCFADLISSFCTKN